MKGVEHLELSLRNYAEKAGGSVLTRDARLNTADRLAQTLHSVGYSITSAEQLKPKHIEAYAQIRKDQVSLRTAHNELGHIRQMLREAGKGKVADSSRLSNEQLFGARADRTAARTALDRGAIERIIQATEQRDPGVAAAMRLQAELGLRPREAVQSVQSLKSWERALERGEHVRVVFGTKGGRSRDVQPLDRQRALAAVRQARQVSEQRSGKLVQSRQGTLKAAMRRFSRVAHQAGARGPHSPHSLRYAYAQGLLRQRLIAGDNPREARAEVSKQLGHGDGRGRWVASVYGK